MWSWTSGKKRESKVKGEEGKRGRTERRAMEKKHEKIKK